jgi:hypothetical protein
MKSKIRSFAELHAIMTADAQVRAEARPNAENKQAIDELDAGRGGYLQRHSVEVVTRR